MEDRSRGGSRPGTCKAYYTQVGSGNPVRMMGSVRYMVQDGLTYTNDDFDGAALSSDLWAAATWLGASMPSVLSNYASVTYGTPAGAVRTAITALDTTLAYQIDLWISPYAGQHNGTYYIYGKMNDTTPNPIPSTGDGFVAALTMTAATGAYSCVFTVYKSGVAADATTVTGTLGATSAFVKGGWFSVLYNPSGTAATVYWNGVTLVSAHACTFGAGAGNRVGFGMSCTVAGGMCLADEFRVQYRTNSKRQTITTPVVVSSNGLLYKESYIGTFAQVSSNLTLASDRQLMCGDRGQKLYIADNQVRATGTATGTTTSGVLDDAAVTSWNALSIDPHDDVVVISSGTSATLGTFTIASVHDTNGVTMQTTSGINPAATDGTAVTYSVERAPKVYDPVAATLTLLTAGSTLGQVPSGCPLMAIYRDRLVLAGAPSTPQAWYMSRQGTFTDWDYSVAATDGGRAVAGTSTDTGRLAAPAVALAAWANDYMLVGCSDSLWIMRGDPAYGGKFDNIAHNVGIVGPRAWCFGPNGEFVWLSAHGLYWMAPNAAGMPIPISQTKLPQELIHVDGNTHVVSLSYDAESCGVHVFLTQGTSSQRLHWYLDWQSKSFWPVRLPGTMDPLEALEYSGIDAADSTVLMGCRDGYVRRWRLDADNDDGTAITSFIQVGPIQLGDGYRCGLLNEIVGTLGGSSGGVTVSVLVGETAEQATAASAFQTATFSAGRNYHFRPRARAGSCVVKLANSGARAWAWENMHLVRETLGVQRKRQ